jgi:hypothetical protein
MDAESKWRLMVLVNGKAKNPLLLRLKKIFSTNGIFFYSKTISLVAALL